MRASAIHSSLLCVSIVLIFIFIPLCRFTTPVPHLAVYSGFLDSASSPSLPVPALSGGCPSPISVAPDSSPPAPPPPAPPRSRVGVSLRRLLRRGCGPIGVFASLSPKCNNAIATAGGAGGRVQPISGEQQGQAPPKRFGNFFQMKVDIPPECRIYPIEDEEEEEDRAPSRDAGAKEIICPWESLSGHNGTS